MLPRSIAPTGLSLMLIATLSFSLSPAAAEAEPVDDCYYNTTDGERYVCFRTFLDEEAALMVDWLELDLGERVVVGQVEISPLGLGPFTAAGIGVGPDASPCQQYTAFDCEEDGIEVRPGVFVESVEFADACYDRIGIQYTNQGNPPPEEDAWTTIGYYYENSACADPS